MYIKINKTDEILARLKKEGKIRVLDGPEDLKKILEMNKYMEDIHRDYLYKSAMSEISAAKTILNF